MYANAQTKLSDQSMIGTITVKRCAVPSHSSPARISTSESISDWPLR
ncbi:hypothetical protein Thiofri_02461 [Thiorhodovibrio frisius]|nr:hypothetical protein Thiofri_02461 [Thiorhodovibrio frisius]